MHVLVAMSGGVDSSVAAALLADAGHRVTGVFLRNGIAAGAKAASGKQGCCSVGDAADAGRVADVLGIPFYSLDFAAGFERIVAAFARSYAEGRTPNPCVACNRDLKFGRLMEFAGAIGADRVATGHYAALETFGDRIALRVGTDRAKDQTYVLFPLEQAQLRRTVFPLAGLTKPRVREIARDRGLPVAEKPESMELCFVPEGSYRAILAEREPGSLATGDIEDDVSGAVIGRHSGVGTVTIGQRRAVGVVAGAARYVTQIDVARNVVRVGERSSLERREVVVTGWTEGAVRLAALGASMPVLAKIRRTHEPQPAELCADGTDSVRVTFAEPVTAVAPGQALVAYDADGRVVGGGWIASATR